MPTHDIIDNRSELLADHINQILPTAEQAKISFHKRVKATVPFLIPLLVMLVLMSVIPGIVTGLPNLLM